MGKKNLRNVCEPATEQVVWKIRTIQQLTRLYKTTVTARDIKEKRKWFGHVIEMDQANAAKSTVERTPKYKMEVGNTSIEVQMAKTGRELFTAVKMKQ